MDRKSFLTIAAHVAAGIVAVAASAPSMAAQKTAIFAGGCFWCMEKNYEHVPGVTDVESGYTGGTLANPTYRNHAGHVEAVRVHYDDTKVGYGQLLATFWRSVDPTDGGGQFCDRGHSYTTAIFVADETEKRLAESSRNEIEKSGKLGAPVVTPILAAGSFTLAEDYHQDYWRKNPARYSYYRRGCGRDARVEALWGAEAHQGIVKSGS
jgi:methionine-S-sulfoxide reductase